MQRKFNLVFSGRRRQNLFILALFFAAFFVWQTVFAEFRNELLEVNFFDVGEGDSVLVELPGGDQILIDGGPSGDIVEKITREMPLFDREIELLLLTHPDKDHITGFFEVLETFKVDKILMPKISGDKGEKKSYISLQKLAKDKGVEIIFAKEGQKISFADGSTFLIFWPEENFISNKINDYSIVGKLSFGEIDFLFTGDATESVEYGLLAKNLNGELLLESEILKVAHHGSKYSTTGYFLEKILPETAVISVGKNGYGHPSQEVLQSLKKYDINPFRTDKNGDIKIISDGERYQVITKK